MRRLVPVLMVLLWASIASAAPVSIFSAADQFQNGGVNPCIFAGNGGDGCNQINFAFPDPVTSTQTFVPNPLVNTIGDAPGELLEFATNVGRDFIIGLDVNEGGPVQTLTQMTISFFGASNNFLGDYQLGGTPLLIPVTANGAGYTDYVFAAGCGAPGAVGTGVAATCANYTPFSAPTGTRSITFTYGMGTFNDGAERVFLIPDGPGGTVTTLCIDANCDVAAVPEPASMMLMGTGLLGLVRMVRKRKSIDRKSVV